MRPIPCATGIVTVLLVGAYVVATGTPEYVHWNVGNNVNVPTVAPGSPQTTVFATFNHHVGPFRYCNDYSEATGYSDSSCVTIPRDCTVTIQHNSLITPSTTYTIAKNCDQFNAFRGLLIMALLIGALSAIIQFAAGCYAFRPHAGTATAVLSGLCGMVSMALFVALKNDNNENMLHANNVLLTGTFPEPSTFGYSFIIATATWPLMLLMGFFFLFSASQS